MPTCCFSLIFISFIYIYMSVPVFARGRVCVSVSMRACVYVCATISLTSELFSSKFGQIHKPLHKL